MSKLKKIEVFGIIAITLTMIFGSIYVWHCYTGEVTPWLWQWMHVDFPKWLHLVDIVLAWVLYIPACIVIKKVCES